MCEHKIVLEIYNDSTHQEISHFRCPRCGEKRNMSFGKEVIKSSQNKANQKVKE